MPRFPPAWFGRAASLVLACTVAACAPQPQRAGIFTEWQPSPNFNERRPDYVVIHYTGTDHAADALRALSSAQAQVSAHYLVVRDGKIIQLVDERARAWHAGASRWGSSIDINSTSIGIELDNNGREPFTEPLITALLALLADLQARYKLPASSFLAHADVAPGRKADPSALFPWRRLAQHGFGLWCDPPYPAVPAGIDNTLLLQAFGYNIWNPDAAIAAFKLRYAPDDPSPAMTEKDRSMLYCLVQQMQSLAVRE